MAKIVLALILGDGIDLHDVGVRQSRGALRFAHEPLDVVGILRQVFAQDLECDEAVETLLMGLVDHAHATPAQLGDDTVMPDPFDHAATSHFEGKMLPQGRLNTVTTSP
jgi:hypothetical protein